MDVDDDLVRPGEVDVEHRQTLGAVEALQRALDDQRLAEDARRLGERHRQAPLEVRAFGQRRVVVGVAELVGEGLRRVGAARPVHQHQRAGADERHAEGATGLAVAWPGVDPPLVERTRHEAAELGAVLGEGVAHDGDALVPTSASPGRRGTGRPGRTTATPRRGRPPWSAALVRIQRRKSASESATAACMASNVERLTALANSEASSGSSHLRRRLTIVASPLMAFIAAAQGTATWGQATISAS